MKTQQTPTQQADLFLFDLDNSAKEHWFKGDDAWQISLVNDAEKSAIEKQYHPTVSANIAPNFLPEIFEMVKAKLKQTTTGLENHTAKHIADHGIKYIVAFNPGRQR
jgi:hypothetical protein